MCFYVKFCKASKKVQNKSFRSRFFLKLVNNDLFHKNRNREHGTLPEIFMKFFTYSVLRACTRVLEFACTKSSRERRKNIKKFEL